MSGVPQRQPPRRTCRCWCVLVRWHGGALESCRTADAVGCDVAAGVHLRWEPGVWRLSLVRPAPSSSQPCFALTLWRLRRYPQAALAATGDAVAVSINYRVNGFGFMALPELGKVDPRGVSGNYGFLDQQLGLKVRTATLGCQRVATTAWLCAAADMGHAWVRWLGMPVGRGQHRSVWRRSRPRDSVGPVLGRNVCARAPGVAGIAGPVPPRHVSEWQSQHHRGPGVR